MILQLFDLLKCQIEYVIKRLKDKNSYAQIFALYFQDLFLEERDFKDNIQNNYFNYIEILEWSQNQILIQE